MILTPEKICELLRVYAKIFSKYINSNKSLYDLYVEMIEKNETTLSIEDYNAMMLVKEFSNISSVLFYYRDTFDKGFNGLDIPNKNWLINVESELNRRCTENFTDKDIIFYIRNAFAHSKNNLYQIYINENESTIHIRLNNTKASKGPNIGQNVSFEVELDGKDMINLTSFCPAFTKCLTIAGVNIDGDTVLKTGTTSITKMLKTIIDTAYYEYTLLNQTSDNKKQELYEAHARGNETGNMEEFNNAKARYVKKEERIELSQKQKDCICYSMSEQIHKSLKQKGLNPALIRKFWTPQQVKETLGLYFNDLFEYETLKVIPMGIEKHNNSIAAYIISCSFNGLESLEYTQQQLIQDLQNKGSTYNYYRAYNMDDPQERNMFIKNILDSKYIEKEALTSYYRYVFENFSTEGEELTLGNKTYKADIIRNSLTHGRWFFDDEKNNWELFDNSQSRDKPNQYIIDKHITISYNDLQKLADDKYFEHISSNQNQPTNSI